MSKEFNRRTQIKTGVIVSYVNTALTMLIAMLFAPFLLQQLGPDQHGLYSHVTSLTGQVGVLNFGFGTALIRYIAKYRAEGDKENEANFIGLSIIFYSIIAIIILVIGAVFCLNINIFYSKSHFSNNELAQLPILTGVMMVSLAISMPASILSGIISAYERFAFLKMQNLIMLIIRTLIIVALLFVWQMALTIILVDIGISILTMLINLIFISKNIKIRVNFRRVERGFLVEIFSYTFFIFLNDIVARVNWSLDKTILGFLSSGLAVSMYSIAMNVNNMYMTASTAISDLMLPKMTQMMVRKASSEELTDTMIRVGRIQLMILCYILTIFAFFGQEFIGVWVGKHYESMEYAVRTIWTTEMVIMIPFTLVLFQNTGISILQAYGLHKFRSIMLVIISALNVVITVVLVPKLGIVGAAIGTGIGLLIGNVIIINIYYHKKLKIDMWKFYRETFICFLIPLAINFGLAYILNYIPGWSWLTLIVRCVTLLILYLLIIWVITLKDHEKSEIKSIFQK